MVTAAVFECFATRRGVPVRCWHAACFVARSQRTRPTRSAFVLSYPSTLDMLYAYFGGTTATGAARYELLLQQDGVRYTVVAVHQAPPPHPVIATRPWCVFAPRLPARAGATTTPLYRGRDARTALRVLLDRACAVVNTAVLGQRSWYVLPHGDTSAPVLAPLVPGQLRHNNTLPAHPQVWQVGRSLHHLPQAWHATACPEPRLFGDERSTWAWQ